MQRVVLLGGGKAFTCLICFTSAKPPTTATALGRPQPPFAACAACLSALATRLCPSHDSSSSFALGPASSCAAAQAPCADSSPAATRCCASASPLCGATLSPAALGGIGLLLRFLLPALRCLGALDARFDGACSQACFSTALICSVTCRPASLSCYI